jgi:hypothetical protein
MPALVSAGLIAWLVFRVSPQALIRSVFQLDWPPLLVVFGALVLALFLWDALCLRWLFSEPSHPLSYRSALSGRGRSYLLSAFNYELGQGLLAWELAKVQVRPVAGALARCLLLAVHDVGVLLAMGLAGSWGIEPPLQRTVRTFAMTGLALLAACALAATLLPAKWRGKLVRGRWQLWPATWTWLRSAHLCGLRSVYYGLIVGAVACGLGFASVPLDWRLICSVVPLVLLADGLPISASGLGTRETTLLLLLQPEEPAPLIAFSMLWSSTLISGRLLIGLTYWWLVPQAQLSSVGQVGSKENP